MSDFDAILVPGGGVRDGGEVPPWTRERLERAIGLRDHQPVLVLSAGTVHRPPPVDARGFPIFESLSAARYLMARGIDPGKILVETCSYDTIGNAYFARVIHTDPGKFRRLLIITSDFHMPRTEAIFRWVFDLDAPRPPYRLFFESVPDRGISGDVLKVRMEKESHSLQQFLENRKTIHSLNQLHGWLFENHAAYSMSLSPRKERGKILETY